MLEERHKRGRIPAQETLCYARLLSTLAISLDMQVTFFELPTFVPFALFVFLVHISFCWKFNRCDDHDHILAAS